MQAPKRKTSKSKRNMRRSHHAITAKYLGACPQCQAPLKPHHACRECGHYRGKKLLAVNEAE